MTHVATRFIARLWILALALSVCLAATGCGPEKPASTKTTATPAVAVEIKLLVVDDAAIAEAIEQLRGDWKARTRATIVIRQATSAELVAAEQPAEPFDAVIYPAALLGTLAERGWIGPLPADFATSGELAWSDTFELVQTTETTWGQLPYAVSFGDALLVCYYRPDLFERFKKHPPASWAEYHELAAFFHRRENLADAAPPAEAAWSGTIEPLAKNWGGRVLLARAAPYARHLDNYSTLFQATTMEPLIGGPPFVKALEELVADAKLGPSGSGEFDPAAARRSFLAGQAAMTLAFPGHAGTARLESAKERLPIGFVALPGSAKVFNIGAARWDQRAAEGSQRVTLLGLAGRLGSIAENSRHADQAFHLLAWLSGQDWGTRVAAASEATTIYRRSQMRDPRPWVDPLTDSQAAADFATTVHDALGEPACLVVPRLPGQDRYLAALDEAVAAAVAGTKPPDEALQAAADQWRAITAELGVDSQRKAYRNSLGLEP